MATDDESKERKADKMERKKSHKKHHKKHRRRENSSSDEDSYRRKRDKKQRHKKHHYSSDEREERKRRKKRSKDYGSDSSSSTRGEKKKKRKEKETSTPAVPTFGQYGVIKASDFVKKQRSFEIWMAEVKGIQSFNGPRWEAQNYFAEYCEDYNTATLPHIKYYDYDDWEMKEYRKRQQSDTAKMASGNRMLADEARHREEMRQRIAEKERAELELLKSTMNVEKIQDMKHKAQLQSQLVHAFRTGDIETQKKIQRKLEPDRNE
jgi:hypothetical protein